MKCCAQAKFAFSEGPHVKLPTFLALGTRELGEELFVHSAGRVLGALLRIAAPDVAHEADELAEPLLVETGAP